MTHGTPAAATDNVTGDQRHVLQAVFDAFDRRNAWPSFGLIDRSLRRASLSLDPAAIIATLPPAFLLPAGGGRREPSHDDELMLTVLGMSLCEGADRDVMRFLEAVRWMSRVEADFDPGDDPTAKPTITSAGLVEALAPIGGEVDFVPRMWMMLRAQRWGLGSGGGMPTDWWFELTRDIRRFATASNAAEYAQAREDWVRDATRALQPIDRDPTVPDTDKPQGGEVARVTINHQEIARMMRDIQASFDQHPIRVPIHTEGPVAAPGPTNVFNAPVIFGDANGAQLAWNNHTANQTRTGDDAKQIAAGFEAITQTIVSIMKQLPAAGLEPADQQDADDAAGEVLEEVTAPEPNRGRIRRAVTVLKGVLAPLAIGATTGAGEGVHDWAKTAVEQLSQHL